MTRKTYRACIIFYRKTEEMYNYIQIHIQDNLLHMDALFIKNNIK